MFSRRSFIKTSALASTTVFLPYAVLAKSGSTHTFEGTTGQIVIRPVNHASFVMELPNMVVYNDPVGGTDAYDGLPRPDLILVTHHHQDHFDVKTLNALLGVTTKMIVNQTVYDALPANLRAVSTIMINGDTHRHGNLEIEAIAAYNYTEDRLKYHPKGRDNGYLLSIDGKRIYIAGDTEDVPEMKALKNIDIAFLPMILPYTMDEIQAAAGVEAFRPKFVFPFHYGETDINAFARRVGDSGVESEVVFGAWYG